ncbi:MAG: hypothetical protein ACOY99_10070 [Pseudomonadota bacterium]
MAKRIFQAVFATLLLPLMAAAPADERVEQCKKGEDLIEQTLDDPAARLRAWRTWEPQCRGTGLYELVLGRYLAQTGDREGAVKALQGGLLRESAYGEALRRALDALLAQGKKDGQ